ncbi:phosphohistidine phosphatase SixA [soil metagenome]
MLDGVTLYVMRHGPAEDYAATGRDFDRALTAPGRDRVRAVAAKLREMDEAPKLVVASPLVRAQQTADLVAKELRVEAIETDDAFAPGGDGAAFVHAAAAQGKKRLMVVGHEPDLSELVTELLAAPFDFDMLKAMVVGLRITPGEKTEMRFVLDPKTLEIAAPLL